MEGMPSVLVLEMAECVSEDPSVGRSLVFRVLMLGGGGVVGSRNPVGVQ